MFNGKMKALTFSYDDGVTQDIRFIEILNKYGLKCTFNLNSELLGTSRTLNINGKLINHNKVSPGEVKYIYAGHEVAVHTLTHSNLTKIEDETEIIRQVEEDRLNLSALVGYEVIGMAYPCGGVNCNDRVANIIKNNTGVKYSRTITVTHSFDLYPDIFQYKASTYHNIYWDEMLEMGRDFVELKTNTPKIFYIWGHSYEFDIYPERWEMFDEFCKIISGKDDIFYGTNKEIILK